MAYPMPAYHFVVEWGGVRTGFTEVSGLTMETQVIEYREGSSPDAAVTKMPGLTKFSNIVLKRGIQKGDNDFFKWMQSIHGSTVERRDIMISLLNENHEPVMRWRIRNAFPVKIEVAPLRSSANEVAMETIELAHEGLSIETT